MRGAPWAGAASLLLGLGALGSLESLPPGAAGGHLGRPLSGGFSGESAAALIAAGVAAAWLLAAWVRHRRHKVRWEAVERIERNLYSRRERRRARS